MNLQVSPCDFGLKKRYFLEGELPLNTCGISENLNCILAVALNNILAQLNQLTARIFKKFTVYKSVILKKNA